MPLRSITVTVCQPNKNGRKQLEVPPATVSRGVTTLPQRIRFPFSLINTPGEALPGVSPAYNEIIPGWVLSDNLFALKRNEGKYSMRNKARRSHFDF